MRNILVQIGIHGDGRSPRTTVEKSTCSYFDFYDLAEIITHPTLLIVPV